MIFIRQLLPEDSSAWKNLRIQALANNPSSFGASLEDEKNLTSKQVHEHLTANTILGAFSNKILVGILGFLVFEGTRQSHRGLFFGMYVHPEYRSNRIASSLLDAMLEIAKQKVIQVHLAVASHNDIAIRLYLRYGFEQTGIDRRCLKIGEQFYDEDLMVLKLDT